MNNREIKRRIASVTETVKITRAMYSISVAKMTRAKAALTTADRFYQTAGNLLKNVAAASSDYFVDRGERTAFIVIGGDKGLCGDYNLALFDRAYKELRATEERFLFIVGGIVKDMLSKAGIEADVEFLHSAENPSPEVSYSMAADLMNLYRDGLLDRIELIYSTVEGGRSVVKKQRMLPFIADKKVDLPVGGVSDMAVERAVYEYLSASLYRGLICASYAENFARMLAMPQATENGEKMISELTSEYNKARQEGITRALADVGSRMKGYGE